MSQRVIEPNAGLAMWCAGLVRRNGWAEAVAFAEEAQRAADSDGAQFYGDALAYLRVCRPVSHA